MDKPYPNHVRILLAADDENDSIIVRDLLSHSSSSGSTLSWVPGYDEALSALLTGQFDVCLLDCRPGTRNGIEFFEEATRSGCPTPIIFLGGAGDCETDFTAIKTGTADYVGKDEMSAALLERVIRYSLERAETKKRLQEEYDKLKARARERAIDITERKRAQTERRQAEAALRQRTDELQVILDTVPATIWFKDRDNNFLRVNKATCEMMGLPATSIEGKNASEIFPDWLAEKYYRDDLEVINSRQPKMGIEEQVCNAAGELRWVSTDKTPWFDAQGNLAGLLAFAVDVTDRKRAEQERKKLQQQLFQSQKMESVGRLAGGVAHDYNNMLGVIIGYTEIALESLRPDEPLHSDLLEILKAAKRSADITRQLLAFARKQTICPVVLDLNETVDGMLKMLRRLIGEDIDLTWHPKAGLWPVTMDPSQIDQILANLAVNARDAISGVGKVTIETDTVVFDETYCAAHEGFIPGEFVLLAVSDDGCGMERQTLENIFEPFFTTKDVDKGTGLGLSTVYGIVKQNGGFINVYSEPGHGTTFKIYLPRARVQVSQKDTPRDKKRDLRGTETILLVEDEESILGLGKIILERHGYTVLTAHNPADALDVVKDHASQVHLLITDVVMPGMSGRELYEKLRLQDPKLKCIYMSGYTANVIAHNSVLEGGINFLQKPFSVRTLTEKTRDVLDG